MEQLMQYETLSFSEAVNRAASRIFQFTGRSRRSEYWWTMFLVVIISVVVPLSGIILNILTIPLTFRRLHDTGKSGWWWGIRYVLYLLFIATSINDIVNILISFDIELLYPFLLKQILWFVVFAIYYVAFFVILCLDGEQETNEYGESEKYYIEITNDE